MKKIKIADKSGFCFGVKRAIDLAEGTLGANKKVYTLGPIIHNPQEVKRLEQEGIKTLDNPQKIKSGIIVLRTHGIPLQLHEKLQNKKNIKIIDATCPFVKRAQDIVKDLSAKNETVVIVGEKLHPEVAALVSYGAGKSFVVENPKEAKNLKIDKNVKINVVSQTTQTPENFNSVVKELKKHFTVKVFNTICKATLDRQQSAERLAKKTDLMIVVGGKNSGNTARLTQICSDFTKTRHIETVGDIKKDWFKNADKIGVTAGASTPGWIIKQVKEEIEKQLKVCKKSGR
ncbi:4-hydroxy-3-methylbut-2-enyl diphosphate reductase [Endomicrobium proavitum]|uniref:4-hydroxy-3-methylbut-2-enyl diphosphate reductase n=1 Tax=Endomicrobium proavitum TaxID=1408281 RepID=A0A0G3WL89_9BACT|nr:4-hydroxy-3-methylbut-2-enyl diphosphate reductase [Endomicrobium proavitum]AKL98655.1 4-hydroxy-3-methylbut-2-enyl diphosphate reductase [Endomicrobium proavitum]